MEKIITFIAENKKRELEKSAKVKSEQKLPERLPEAKKVNDLIKSFVPYPSL